jgi:hypothetical protein
MYLFSRCFFSFLVGSLLLVACGGESKSSSSNVIDTNNLPPTPVVIESKLTDFSVKETVGVTQTNYPISIVFPVKYGTYQTVDEFHIRDENGAVIPAQFHVLNRWWGKDNSIRHVQAHFNTSVTKFEQSIPESGIAKYTLFSGTANIEPNNPVTVIDNNNLLMISNGLVEFIIDKTSKVINTPAGKLQSILFNEQGERDYSFKHDNIDIEIEEQGSIRTVLKLSSLTHYKSPTDIKHGWAMRLYFHANSPLVEMDFQLQNSAINVPISAPLYFRGHIIRFDDAFVEQNQQHRADYMPLADIQSLPLGALVTKNVNVFLKDFWQTFPNGLESKTNGQIDIELWPTWSKQFYDDHFVEPDIYWLDDMKQSYKEVLLDFSGNNEYRDVQELAKTFQYPPVTVIPQEYYAQTKATIDLGGYFPLSTELIDTAIRTPSYENNDYESTAFNGYRFGLGNFGIDTDRKRATANTGGWPYSANNFLITGNPADFYNSLDFAKAEINIRPQWLSGYIHERDYKLLTPSTNPYAGNTWRRFLGHGVSTLTRDYIEGTARIANPRDDQHAWFYHVKQVYLVSGNKWLKDWFENMAEFKMIYLEEKDPWPDRMLRAVGHSLSLALDAYQVSGNKKLAVKLKSYPKVIHSKYISEPHSIQKGNIASFQVGFLTRAMANIYDEFPTDNYLLEMIGNYIEWNQKVANFSYYIDSSNTEPATKASGTGLTLVDPAIWYSIRTNNPKYADHAMSFVQHGIGGQKPYGQWSHWQGQYESATYHYYKQDSAE